MPDGPAIARRGAFTVVVGGTGGLELSQVEIEFYTRLQAAIRIASTGAITLQQALTLASALGVGQGGTGLSTIASGAILYASALDTLAALAAPSADRVLTHTGTVPAWALVADANVSSTAAIAYSKLANVSATDRVLGRQTAGAGAIEEITCTAAGRALIDDATAAAQRTTLGLGALATLATVGTTEIADDAVTYAKIQNVSATSRALGRNTAGAGDTEEVTLSQILDWIGSAAQGDILYRGATAWARLAAGTSGNVLQTNGAGANPSWAAASGGSVSLLTASSGTTTTTTAENVATVAISGLTVLDTIQAYVTLEMDTQAGGNVDLYNNTDSVNVVRVATAATDLQAGDKTQTISTVGNAQSANTRVLSITHGSDVVGDTEIRTSNNVAFTTAWTGSWTLALRQAGVVSGGTLRWRWRVFKIAGQ